MAKQISVTQVESVRKQLQDKQGNKCAICGKPFTSRDKPVLDHDHDTGFIRGVLHNSCNGIEGKVKTKAYMSHKGVSPHEYIIGLGKYLEHHSTPKVNLIHPTHMTEDQKRLERNRKARLARQRKVKNGHKKSG